MKLELIKITRDEKIEFILCVNSIKHFNVFYDDGKMLEFSGNSDIKTAKDYARIRQQFVKESHEPIDLEENWDKFLEILENSKTAELKEQQAIKKEYKDVLARLSSRIYKINNIRREASTERWKKIRNN